MVLSCSIVSQQGYSLLMQIVWHHPDSWIFKSDVGGFLLEVILPVSERFQVLIITKLMILFVVYKGKKSDK
jgi:hypothetical protein